MAHLLVIGASRGIGRETVREALASGHRVRGMARSIEKAGIADEAFEPFAGDASDGAALREALAGIDAVVHALGVGLSARTIMGPVDLFSRSTEATLAAMEGAGVKRLVAVTGIGTGDSRDALSTVENVAKDLAMGAIYRDKSLQETMIRNAPLDWTLVRPTFLTTGARTGRYRVMTDAATWRNGMISRADVAHFIVREIETGACIGQGPILAY